jgi:isoquinoline 1-oxidoreductase subunit beta
MTSHRGQASRGRASALDMSRRRFIQVSVAAGGGLLLSCCVASGGSGLFVPNAFIRVDGDGQIVLTMPYVEMGQGTYTAIPMLIAEELEVNLQQIRLEHGPPKTTRGRSALPTSASIWSTSGG